MFYFLLFGIFSYLSDFKILKFTLFPIILITSIFVISVKLVLPPARVWVFFIPFFLIVVDNGFSKIIDNLKNKKKLFLFLLIIIYSLSITQTFSNKALINIEEISFADAEIAVKYLESQRIIMNLRY